MTQPWKAEHVVSCEHAAALIDSQFPDLRPVHVEPLAVGWDNTALLVNGAYVFRFPRREIALGLFQTERRLLPAVASRLPVAVPVPEFFGEPDQAYPWPFAGYAYLPRTTADVADLTHPQRAAIAEPLGRFLAALHAVSSDEARSQGLPGDTLGRVDLAKRVPMARDNLRRLVELGLIADARPLLRIVDEMDVDRPIRETTTVHGDLYARQLLVDDDGALCGIIDWGDAHIGDPAVDLSIAHGLLPPAAHAAFCAAYGPIDDDTWRVAGFRALYHATVTIRYGREIQDDALVRESMAVLRHLSGSA